MLAHNHTKNFSLYWSRLGLALLFVVASACDRKDDHGGGGDTATTPLDNRCLNQACDTSIYNQPGWRPYPTSYAQYGGYGSYYNQYYAGNYNYNYYGQFCDCPSGYMPVYGNDGGLGCVQNVVIQPYFSFALYVSLNTNNNWSNAPIMSSVQGPASSNNCFNSALRSCLVDLPQSCGYGFSCQVTSGGSRVGICVRR